jgi:hypothetical protein
MSNVPAVRDTNTGAGTLLMEDARIVFRNFAGKEGQYNREGDRNFCVILPPDLAEAMAVDGWNIKQLRSREEGVPGDFYIQVSVGFKGRPPTLVIISSAGRVDLGQHEAELLDWVDIKQADLIINPYHWNVNGKSGIKAYVKSLFIIINEDFLQLKYADVPQAAELNAAASDANTRSVEATAEVLSIDRGNQSPDDIIDGEVVEDDD